MSPKIAWITFFVTLVYWFGQATGCASNGDEQNYKLLEEDRPRFSTEPGGGAATDAPAQMTPTTAQAVESVSPPVTIPAEAAVAAQPAAQATVAVSDAQPSVTSMDRSHWGKVSVSPVLGVTHHWPHYFNDLAFDQRSELDVNAQPDLALEQALDQTRALPFTVNNGLGFVAQPLKFAFDIAALPVYMVLTPPWSDVTTPAGYGD